MVSFTCARCQDVVKKPKTQSHAQSCGTTHYSCVDCMEVFDLHTVKAHNTCISEEDKYQGRWKNKGFGANAASARAQGTRTGTIVDSDGEDEEAKLRAEKALLMQRVRPSAKNFLASSDSDDEDWVAGGGGKPAAAKRARAANGSKADAETQDAPPTKKPRTPRSAGLKSHAPSATPPARTRTSESKVKRHTPLLLPASTAELVEHVEQGSPDGNVHVDGFVLGRQAEVQDILLEVLATSGDGRRSMRPKEVARELAERYRARIAKNLRAAVAAAVAGSGGALLFNDEGNVCAA